MSLAAANADAFVIEVVGSGSVWTIRDKAGFPTSTNMSGEKAMPFWSKESRARHVIDGIDAYRGFQPVRLGLAEFVGRWLPGLERDGLLVGMNWSGRQATGFDMRPADIRARLAVARR